MNIPDYQAIHSLADFQRALIFLRRAINENLLEQYFEGSQIGESRENAEMIPIDGPYPDMVFMYFKRLRDGARFLLSVDTYHGVGGEWKKLEDGKYE